MADNIILQYFLPTLISSGVLIIIAVFITRRQMFHPALEYIQNEYRKPEMLDALNHLWKLHDDAARQLGLTNRVNGRQLSDNENMDLERKIMDNYKNLYNAEEQVIRGLYVTPLMNRRGIIIRNPTTIAQELKIRDETSHYIFDNKRRLVSHFFAHLEVLMENRILTKRQIKRTFPSATDTIRKISIPLEKQLVDIICDKRPWINDTERGERKQKSIQKLERLADMIDGKPILSISMTINGHRRPLINWVR